MGFATTGCRLLIFGMVGMVLGAAGGDMNRAVHVAEEDGFLGENG